jgi:hypothetical protein
MNKNQAHTSRTLPYLHRPFLAWIFVALIALTGEALAAITLSPASVSLPVGSTTTVMVGGTRGEVQAESRDTAVATVSVSGRSGSATITVRARGVGSTIVNVRADGSSSVNLPVTVGSAMVVSPTSIALTVGATAQITASNTSGQVTATSANARIASVSVNGNVATVAGVASGATVIVVKDSRTTINVPVTVLDATGSLPGRYSLVAWNDLGMHCMDGKDYSVFSILPPYNNLHAQLVNATTGKLVTDGVTLTYEAIADPTGSINTQSASKTNFWSWVSTIYGASPAPNIGLTGNPTPSLTASAMALDPANGWFQATALPITPYDEAGGKNYYPTVRVTARDATGKVLAMSTTVLPVSDEITCAACHASRPVTEANPARVAARPAAGWVNDPDPEVDWKKNILRLHDEKFAASPKYWPALAAVGLLPSGLYGSALAGKPALCAACHASNALPGFGVAGVSALTSALHTNHGTVKDPATLLALDASTNRSACYMCHPGSVTKCLRGAMGNAVDAQGIPTMGCQSCHGNMTKVGDPARVGWLEEPNCQACHYNGTRTDNALDASGRLVVPTDKRFATNANAPAAGFSLFRFSKGHGGLQCEACHGATHAEYPSSHDNDNLQSIALQGYAGTIRECAVCHATAPLTTDGGPHGMHTIGAAWVTSHGSRTEGQGAAACAYCHGADYRGSPLAQVKAARSFSIDGSNRSYAAGQNVGCYDCHRGPNP